VKKKWEFAAVQDDNKKLHTKHLLLLVRRTGGADSRIGLTVTTRLEPRAVRRNRIKRRLRELFRHNRHRFVEAVDIVVIARQGSIELPFEELKREFLGALKYHRFMS
jgi:ribonuclease P protein component